MSGPLTSSVLLLFLMLLLQSPAVQAKSLSGMHGGGSARHRRDLRDSLPYEAQMMSYRPADFKSRGNEYYYQQPEVLRAQGLGQALQRLVENDQRRDQEAAYMAGLLRMLSEAENSNNNQGKQEEEEDEEEGDFQGPYPPDYDETVQTLSLGKLDPKLTEALLNRYRQERLLQAGINPTSDHLPEREQEREQEVLRYLVEKILSSLVSGNQPSPPNHRSKRDVVSVGRGGVSSPRRARRSLDSAPDVETTSLLRVKRLGDEDEEEDFADQNNRAPHAGLQRMKRIDTDLPPPPKLNRRRRSVTYDPDLFAQQILQYLPA